MSLVKSPDLTLAKVAANRANSLKSTGPTTPEGKALARLSGFRHGLYVLSPRAVLIALGEDPDEFGRYERALLDKWQPCDAFQEALVRRIACNSWRVERARRVQESTMVRELEKLELDRAVKAQDHAQRIQGILAALNELLQMTRQAGFGDGRAARSAFDRVYGPQPSERGTKVLDLICALTPAVQVSSGEKPGEAAALPPEEQARTSTRLSELLEMEIESVRRYDESYRLLHIEITPAERGSTMGPVQAHASTMIRQEESLARRWSGTSACCSA